MAKTIAKTTVKKKQTKIDPVVKKKVVRKKKDPELIFENISIARKRPPIIPVKINKLILGVDPARNTGIAIGTNGELLEYEGIDFNTQKGVKETHQMLLNAMEYVSMLCRKIDAMKEAMGIEYVYAGIEIPYVQAFNLNSFRLQYGIVGIFLAYMAKHNYIINEINPKSLKKSCTGSGNAKKEDMIRMSRELYGYEGKNDNIADAIMIYDYVKREII